MKKHFTKVLCSLVLLATINPVNSLAQDNTLRRSNQQTEEIKSPVCNTRDNNWYSYDDGIFVDAIGGPQSFLWGIMLPSTKLSEGQNITKVSFYDYVASTGDINIYFGGNTSPELLVHKQPYATTGVKDFVEFDLTSPLPLFGDNLWIVLSTNEGSNFPAAICKNAGDRNGRWISLDNSTWEDVTSYSIDGTWMIRAYIEGGEGISELISSVNVYPNPAKDQLFVEAETEVQEVNVYDIYGRQHDSMTTSNQGNATVNVSELSNGVYFVKIRTNNEIITKQFIKK